MSSLPSVDTLRRQLLAERRRTAALLAALDAGAPANDPAPAKPAAVPNNDMAEAFAREVARKNGWTLPKKAARR